MLRSALAVCALIVWGGGVSSAQDAASFVDQVQMISPQISPDGGEVAMIRKTGTEQELVVFNLAAKKARSLQTLKNTGRYDFDWVRWKSSKRLVIGATIELFERGTAMTGQMVKQKDQTFQVSRVLALDADGSHAVQMFQGQLSTLVGNLGSTMLLDELPRDPGNVLISAWDNSGFGAWIADVETGKARQLTNGDWRTVGYATDGAGYPVLRVDAREDVEKIFRRPSGSDAWIETGEVRRAMVSKIPEFATIGPGAKANEVYVLARHRQDRASLFLYNAATGEFGEPLVVGVDADIDHAWINPVTRELIATCEFAARQVCKTVDPKLQKYVNALDQFFEGKAAVRLVNMSSDQTKWLLQVEIPTEGRGLYVFDTKAVNIEKIAEAYPAITPGTLSPVEVVPYTARDGAKLFAYVTARPGATPRPAVVMPHGGPSARDYYGFDALAQFLAAQGYVVIQPNFRGSDGFGETFERAGWGQWGGRMQDDVSDAVKHMVDAGRVDSMRICIVGASYGGYAALAGVAFTPELFKCAISIAGVSDLPELLKSERHEYGRDSNLFYLLKRTIGDLAKDQDSIKAASPRRQAARIGVPVLLIHGEKDVTVPIAQSEIMQDALKSAGKEARLIKLRKANHYWDEWEREDLLTMYRETAAFLKQRLN